MRNSGGKNKIRLNINEYKFMLLQVSLALGTSVCYHENKANSISASSNLNLADKSKMLKFDDVALYMYFKPKRTFMQKCDQILI